MQHFILYKTTNLINNKTYIGIHSTNKLDDGYLGSGLAMKRAIKKYGKENFKREILELCSSYDELIEREKFHVNYLWVNEITNYNLKTGGQNVGTLSDESKNKISESLKTKYRNGEIIYHGQPYIPTDSDKKQMSEILKKFYEDKEHHRLNTIPWNKGKTGLQTAWNKGINSGPMSEEQKENISNTLKERYKTNIHPRKGKGSWCKGKKLPPSWNSGIKMPKTECPYCKKIVDNGNGKRWHFDNCKFK